MSDHRAKAAREAFAAWQAGRLGEAAQLYAVALSGADRTHYETPIWTGAFGQVLAAQGHGEEARAQFHDALNLELEQGGGAESAAASVARYFLAAHLVRLGEGEEALAVARDGLDSPHRQEAILRCVEAEALAALGDQPGAQTVALKALAAARSQEQRARLLERIGHLVSQ